MHTLHNTLFKLDLRYKNLHPQRKRLITFCLVILVLSSFFSWEYYQTRRYQEDMAVLKAENAELRNKLYGIARFGVNLDQYISNQSGQFDSALNFSPQPAMDTLYRE